MPRYRYTVLRYVPDVVRDEAINVGVMLQGLEGAPFAFRFLPRAAAVHKLDPRADETLVRKFKAQLQKATKSGAPFGSFGHPTDATFFEKLQREFTGNLQLTSVRGLVADQPSVAVQQLYTEYVAEPGAPPRPISYQVLAPSRLRDKLWTAFDKRGLVRPGRFERTFTIPGRHASWAFDLGSKNGRIEVISSIALNSVSPETNLGRALVFRGMLEDVKAASKIDVLATAVIDSGDGSPPGISEAHSIIKDAGARAVEAIHIDDLANSLAGPSE